MHEPGLGSAALRLMKRVYDVCVGHGKNENLLFLVDWTQNA